MSLGYKDISDISDCAYIIAEVIGGGHYRDIIYLEFHEQVNPDNIWNCLEGFNVFCEESNKNNFKFISASYLDSYPAIIHVAVKLSNEWYIMNDCGANYYFGYGPRGIQELRKACMKSNVLCQKIEGKVSDWILKEFDKEIELTDFDFEKLEFHSVMKQLEHYIAEMQRRPSHFENFSENKIRDHLLMYLNSAFKGRANGEAINNKGKTDILIRTKNGLNEFVFELKKWHGIKTIIDALSQLRGYLAWHNNFASLIIFCYNTDYTKILRTVQDFLLNNKEYKIVAINNQKNDFKIQFDHSSDSLKKIECRIVLVNLCND